MSFSLIENVKVVPIAYPKDFTGAAMTTEYISMKNYRKATIFVMTGVQTSTSNRAMTLVVADDASGTHHKTITSASAQCTLGLDEYWKAAGAGDTWTRTAVSSSTFNITKSSDSKMIAIEVEASEMGTFVSSSTTYSADYFALSVATPGAHAALAAAWAVLSDPRYASDAPPTAIT
jgi:hypothetical protein